MIKFKEESHQYSNDAGEIYTSVTTLLKKYQPYKDWNKIATKYAKTHKLSVQEVKDKWAAERNRGANRGTVLHKYQEKKLLEGDGLMVTGQKLAVYPCPQEGEHKYIHSLKLENGIYPELILYSDWFKIAGQADRIDVVDDYIHIRDYKTNKEIKKNGYVNWEGIEEKLLAPVDHLPNCEFSIYSLQINIYAFLLLQHNPGKKIGTMEIHHFSFEEDNETIKSLEVLPVPNLQREVRSLLKHHGKNI